MPRLDLTGLVVGHLTAVAPAGRDGRSRVLWRCRCACGNECLVQSTRLKSTHTTSCGCKRRRRGEQHPNWKGDAARYTALHRRVRMLYGRADHCTQCGLDDPQRDFDWANLTGRYEDPKDYASMCVPCHRSYDRARAERGDGGYRKSVDAAKRKQEV